MRDDAAHKRLLDAGWIWDGYRYTRHLTKIAVKAVILPNTPEEKTVEECRLGTWALVLYRANRDEPFTCYRSLKNAASAALGDERL